jgi:hypothetical protein
MIAKNWMKWTAGTVAGLMLAAMPAVGQARTYTGRTPASMVSSRHAAKLVKHKKHAKHSKHHQLSSKSHHHASKAAKIKA